MLAGLDVAPDLLALLGLFGDQSGLREHEDYSVSCLPGTHRGARAATVSVGWVEVFFVLMNKGALTEVCIYVEQDADLQVLEGWHLETHPSGLQGGGWAVFCPVGEAPSLLGAPAVGSMMADRVAGLRTRRARARRHDWHNRWLWALVNSAVAASPSLQGSIASADDVTAPDALRLVRTRTSQQLFRALLLSQQVNECAICGIDLIDVLEAAHLVPHARGGKASVENGRLLCANHHRAYDAGLYLWTGTRFAWNTKGPEIPLGGSFPVQGGD